MPPVQWPLQNHRPAIEVVLPRKSGEVVRRLLADTGAGSVQSPFQLVLSELDCRQSRGPRLGQIQLGDAYAGAFLIYSVKIRIPTLSFADTVQVVGVSRVPPGFDGIAAFRFLNRFHYGNFGNPDQFGLE